MVYDLPSQTVYPFARVELVELQMSQYGEKEHPLHRLVLAHDQQVFVGFRLQLELFVDFYWLILQLVLFFALKSKEKY